jgi:serine protease Do
MKRSSLLRFVVLLSLGAAAPAETVKDREGAVRQDRATLEGDARWIYNDWQRGFDEARRTGMPLLVVLRCVPCLACAGIDAQVLSREEESLAPLLSRFICVRVINANALDLSLFQFDYDLSFSAMFFHGDGTILGRYGSWKHQKAPQDKTTAGFRHALEAALALHKGYPANRDQLAGKRGEPFPFQTPVEMPGLAGRYRRELDWSGKVVQSCVHCHQIGDAMRERYRGAGRTLPVEWIYPWPSPETIGLKLAPEQPTRLETVIPGAPAAEAGLREGDEIVAMDGQPLISEADASWVLHRATERATLPVVVRRAGKENTVRIALSAGWRRSADISRRVGTWPMRAMAVGGLRLDDMAEEERTRLGLPSDRMALLVKHVGEYGKHAAAKKAGFRAGDVLVEVDGSNRRATESELIGRLLEKQKPGEKVKASVMRAGERIDLILPIQ